MKTKTTSFDVANYLETPAQMAAYLSVCLEEPTDDDTTIQALEEVFRAKGDLTMERYVAQLRQSGATLSVQELLKILDALDLKLRLMASHG